MVIPSADNRVCTFVCCLDAASCRGDTGGWVMPGLVSGDFLCMSSHYLIVPRVSSGFPRGLECKVSICNAEDLGSIPEPGGSPGEGSSLGSWS